MSKYEQRVMDAKAAVIEFLDGYGVPRGMSEDAQVKRINGIAESFARNMPTSGDYQELMQGVFQKVADTYDGMSWPSQARFVSAMPRVTGPQPSESTGKQQYRVEDRSAWLKDRMSRNEGVSETVIWGPGGSAVDIDLLEKYRENSVKAWLGAYGDNAYEMMRSRYGTAVDPYFSGHA